MDLNTIDCVLCGSRRFKTIYRESPSNVVECKECKLVFYNPQPSSGYLTSYYSSKSGYLPSIEENLRSFEDNPKLWFETADWILYKIYQHIGEEKNQRILDIGSAYGFFLMFAKQRGLDVLGLEISTETSRYARDHGVTVQAETLSTADLQENSFDIVTMNNVLEHTLNPVADLERVFSILRSPGVIYIGLPNWDSLVSHADGPKWKMKSWPNHLFYFTPDTLTAALTRAGFRVVESFTHMGESDYQDDVRIVRERLFLAGDQDIRPAIECLWSLGKGQELVMIAKKE